MLQKGEKSLFFTPILPFFAIFFFSKIRLYQSLRTIESYLGTKNQKKTSAPFEQNLSGPTDG